MVELNLLSDLMIFIIGFGIGFLIAMGMAVKIISDKHDLQREVNMVKEQRDFYAYLISSNNIPTNIVRQYDKDEDYYPPL